MMDLILKKLLLIAFCLSVSVCFTDRIDIFKLVENGTPAQLESARKGGANFNVERDISDFENDIEMDDDYWPFDTGETPLHRAAHYNHNPESIKFLIKQGIDINAIAEVGNSTSITPLACALWAKNIVAVKELLKNGADPNAWVVGGYNFVGTSFHIVAFDYDNNLSIAREVINELIKAGGNINSHEELLAEELKDLKENEPEFAQNSTIFLPRDKWTSDEPFHNMTDFFSHYALGNFLTTFTPLMWAIIYDKPDVVDIFLDFNADVNIRSVENKSAFDYANELSNSSRIKNSSVIERLKKQ